MRGDGDLGRAVAWRHSLVTRLLLLSVVVVILAVTATAWLAARTTTQALQQEQGRSSRDDRSVYDALMKYAATHTSWSQAGSLLRREGARVGHRVTVTTTTREVLADSATGGDPIVAAQPLAILDPLRVDLSMRGDAADDIDPHAVGPYRLDEREAAAARRAAQGVVACLSAGDVAATLTDSPSGRPVVETAAGSSGRADDAVVAKCGSVYRHYSYPTERAALAQLAQLTASCLGQPTGRTTVPISPDWWTATPTFQVVDRSTTSADERRAAQCLEQARRTQLEPYTAPAALLFVTDADSPRPQPVFSLSRRNVLHIGLVSLAVLAVALLLSVFIGRRLARPLRELTARADDPGPGLAELSGRDEIGRLAGALSTANQRRETAEEQRRAMVADVAHELRNPLTNVLSWIEAAQDGHAELDASLLELLHAETDVLRHVVEDLTDLASADAGSLRLHREDVDLRQCLKQVLDAYASAAAAAGVRLVADLDDAGSVHADPLRLRQLVGNLLSNGIRYTPAGGVVTLGVRVEGPSTRITVRDTGVGMTSQELAHVFERFWRADPSRSRATGGSGLGLAIARHLAEAHGGSIEVHSDQGDGPSRGTTFTLLLPGSPLPNIATPR